VFCFPLSAKDFDAIITAFNTIQYNHSPLTFIFLHQESDGEGNYDIFRTSE
jgi:hypothetical protein